MKRYMFGLDRADVRGSARRLRDLGYDAVVLPVGDPSAFVAAREAGLRAWLCYGAHALGGFSQAEFGAKDARGGDAPWFGSACPNAQAVHLHNQDRAFAFAQTLDGCEGLFVDGARFASFASSEGPDAFFSCFCQRCMALMDAMGLKGQAVRAGIAALWDDLEGGEGDPDALQNAVSDWLEFRAACVKDDLERFAQRAHAGGFKAGAFVFAPSLWRLVGQRPDALGALDVVAPMLYRDYPHRQGPACLSHEWAALKGLLSRSSRSPEALARALFGIDNLPDHPMRGFSPPYIGEETAAARAQLGDAMRIAPIVQTEDARLEEVVACVMASGADGCGEYMYAQKFPSAP